MTPLCGSELPRKKAQASLRTPRDLVPSHPFFRERLFDKRAGNGCVGHKRAVRAAQPIRRLPRRVPQVSVHQANVKSIQKRTVVEQRAPPAALRITRDLAFAQGKIAGSANRQTRQLQRGYDAAENELIAVLDAP